jgi:SAM-dependent methyltransferase
VFQDKNSILENLDFGDVVILELGCGNRKRIENSIGIDILDYPCVDIVGDLSEVLQAFPAHSVDRVTSHHVLEHLDDLGEMLIELARVFKHDGQLEIVVPHFSNPYFFSDTTHKSFFGLYTLCYFSSGSPFKRKVPSYNRQLNFEIVTVDLVFKSSRPFYFRHGLKRLLGYIFNFNCYTRELYEENFCYIFPCYELRYVLRRADC